MKIALAQINTIVGDLEGNYNKIIKYVQEAKNKKCDIVVFPELTISGYPPEDLILKNDFIENQLKYVEKIQRYSNDICIVLGVITKQRYNSCWVLGNRRVQHIHIKKHLPNYSVFDEKRYFQIEKVLYPHDLILNINNKKIGFQICEDSWKDDIFESQKIAGVEIVINMSASPYYIGKLKERKELFKEKAKKFQIDFLYCNLVGGQDELIFDGGSMAINKTGKIINESPQFHEHMLIYDTNSNIINELTESRKEYEVWEALKLGLKDYVRKNGFKKVVFGLSGGIDSALVAKLAVDALGKENVLALTMPSHYTSTGTLTDSWKLAKILGIKCQEIEINPIFKQYTEKLEKCFNETVKGLTEQNLQARIRGNLVMACSNKFGYLPLACGNKSEYSVGYATIYGDMCGGFAPIKDIYKTEVYKLAKWLNNKKEIIPWSIIEREPSAELAKDQKDTDSLPSYEILDKILKLYLEENKSKEEIYNVIEDKYIVDKVIKLIKIAEYKRRQSPIGTKITKRAFCKDWRMPISNQYQE